MSRKIGFPVAVRLFKFSLCLFASAIISAGPVSGQVPATAPAQPVARAAGVNLKPSLPLVFEENAGQMPSGTAFAGRTQQYTVELRPDKLRFNVAGNAGRKSPGRTVDLSFIGTMGGKPAGLEQAGFRTNLYLGNDPSTWHTGVRNFDRVALKALYPGIDAEFYARSGEIEHDFIIAPGANAGQLAMHLAGAKGVTLTEGGDVTLSAEEGALRLHRPEAYQVLTDGKRLVVEASFELAAKGGDADLRFKLGKYDHSRTLVIDPVITYATYVSGTSGSTAVAVTTDTAGDVFLTGSTQAAGISGVPSPNVYGYTPSSTVPSGTVTFVAELATADSGSKIAWLTYYGDAAGTVVPTAITLSSAGDFVYIGGTTNTADVTMPVTPSISFDAAPPAASASGSYGFVVALNTGGTAPGSFDTATYISTKSLVDASSTTVTALTSSSAGIAIGGTTTATKFPTTSNAYLAPAAGAGTNLAGFNKGFVLTLDNTLTTLGYGTLLTGEETTVSPNILVKGLAVDSLGDIYVAGSTDQDFPKAGAYGTVAADFFARPAKTLATDNDGFVAEIVPSSTTAAPPTASTLAYSVWTDGPSNDLIGGLSIDSARNVYVFGSTVAGVAATALLTDASGTSGTVQESTPVHAAPPAVATATGYSSMDAVYPAGAVQAAFVLKVASSGSVTAATYLAGESGSTSSVAAGAVDAKNNFYAAGLTDATKTEFPQQVSGPPPVAGDPAAKSIPLLARGQDLSADTVHPVSGPPVRSTRGYLVELAAPLTGSTTDHGLSTTGYLAYLGGAGGTSQAVGVSLVGGEAFVALNTAEPLGDHVFTTASAAQTESLATSGTVAAAYVASIATAASGVVASIKPGTESYSLTGETDGVSPAPVAYVSASEFSPFTLKFQVVDSGAGASDVVFDLPPSPYLQAYTKVSSNPAADCTIGPGATPGISCALASLAANDTAEFDVETAPTAAVNTPTPPSSFTVSATAYDAEGDAVDLSVKLATAGVPTLKLTVAATTPGTPSPAGAAGTANAALAATDASTPNTGVTYTYTISNTGGADSPESTLNTRLASLSKVFSQIGTATITTPAGSTTPNCDPTSVSGCDIPAGKSLVYSVSGVYLASQFAASGNGPFASEFLGTVSNPLPSASFNSPLLNAPPVSIATFPAETVAPVNPNNTANGEVTILANAELSVSIANVTALTYPSASATAPAGGYRLGDGASFKVSVSNLGVDQADSATVTVTLPTGFYYTLPAGTGSGTCTGATSPVTCNFGAIAPGATLSVTIPGFFSDTGTLGDAVPPPGTSASPTASLVSTKPIYASWTAAAGLPASPIAADMKTYYKKASASLPLTIYRVNNLAYGISATTPAALASATVNETNLPHQNDSVTYTVALRNSGTSIARGIFFSLSAFPTSSANTTFGTPTVAYTTASSDTSYIPSLNCSTSSAIQIICYGADLTATAAAPSSAPLQDLPAGTYTVTFTATYNELTVPTTATKVQIAQAAGTFYAASYQPVFPSVYDAGTTSSSLATITVQRLTNLVEELSVARIGGAPTTGVYSYLDTTDINLDEHTAGNVPGVNDTVTFTSLTYNMGPNDAVSLKGNLPTASPMISIPIPPYMFVVSVPANCSLPAAAAISSGPNGSTMTCLPVYTATSTVQSQIASCLNSSGTSACPTAGAIPTNPTALPCVSARQCFVVVFNAKYVDLATAAGTVPGASSTGQEPFIAATASGEDVDAPTIVSTTPPTMTVQRAAHVQLASTTLPTPKYTDGSSIPLNSGLLEVGQAALGMNPTTGIGNSSKVFNCERFSVPVVNMGPNYAVGAQLTYSINQGPWVPTQTMNAVVGSPKMESPLNCGTVGTVGAGLAAGTVQTAALGAVGYPGVATTNPGDAYLDGYFDVGALGAANSAPAQFSTLSLTGGYKDSNTMGTKSGDYLATESETLVNTPFNAYNGAVGASFSVTPNSNGSTVPVTVAFSQVMVPGGLTTASVSSAAPTGAALPKGASPYPPDSGASRTLYQPGLVPNYYSAVTTAPVPSGNTGFCVGAAGEGAGALLDSFVKPERVLMWALLVPPTGTTFGKIPIFHAAAASFLNGDITSNVISSGGAYTEVGSVGLPQTPQAQPQRVCGVINGLPTATQPPLSIAVLEPTNFPPYVVASVASSSQPAKGATSASATATLTVTSTPLPAGATTATYDFNDSDPCYTGGTLTTAGTRSKLNNAGSYCNDNPYLVSWLYGGGNIPGASAPLMTAVTTGNSSLPLGQSFNLSGGGEVFIAVSDQATGVPAPKGSRGRGNFFVPLDAGGFTECDPGIPSANYTPLVPCQMESALTGSLGAAMNQLYVHGGQGYLEGNLGVQSFTASASLSSPGLVPLPYPDNSTPPVAASQPPGAPFNPGGSLTVPLGASGATATVTPGQTAGFSWQWLSQVTAARNVAYGANPTDVYTLTCVSVDTQTLATQAMPSGVGCNISATTQSSASGSSTTFTFGATNQPSPCTSTTPGDCNSTAPTILITTAGSETAQMAPSGWKKIVGEGTALGLLFPIFLFRRRLGRAATCLVLFASMAVVPLMLSGCGAGSSTGTTSAATASGTYYFRVVATPPTKNTCSVPPPAAQGATCELPIYSAVFEVVVQSGN